MKGTVSIDGNQIGEAEWEFRVDRDPPFWCPICHKKTRAAIKGDGVHNELVCSTCGSSKIGAYESQDEPFNPSRR